MLEYLKLYHSFWVVSGLPGSNTGTLKTRKHAHINGDFAIIKPTWGWCFLVMSGWSEKDEQNQPFRTKTMRPKHLLHVDSFIYFFDNPQKHWKIRPTELVLCHTLICYICKSCQWWGHNGMWPHKEKYSNLADASFFPGFCGKKSFGNLTSCYVTWMTMAPPKQCFPYIVAVIKHTDGRFQWEDLDMEDGPLPCVITRWHPRVNPHRCGKTCIYRSWIIGKP